jgi:hypothetical protein
MNKMPLNVIEARGKKHLTKAEKEQRKNEQVEVAKCKIRCPDYVRKNSDAYKKWREVSSLLQDSELLEATDVGSLARYCMAHAEYLDLINLREQVSNIEEFTLEEDFKIQGELENNLGSKEAANMWKKVEFIFSSQAVLQFDKAINQKMTVMQGLEDRFCLNLLARTKTTITKQTEKQQTPLEQAGFANV